jgi:hypothetical protein
VNPVVGAVVAGVALVGTGIVVLAQPSMPAQPLPLTPTAAPPSVAAATPKPANFVSIEPAVCALEHQPGPEDEPVPGAGEGSDGGDGANGDGGFDAGGGDQSGMDPADWGTGRWRLCLTSPARLVLEGSAWCRWTDLRDSVVEINGLPIQEATGDYSAVLPTDGAFASIGRQIDSDRSVSWRSDSAQRIDPGIDGRAGAATLDLVEVGADPGEASAASVPPPSDLEGTMRWACGDAPPPRPGRSDGTLTLHLDAPVNADWAVPATCSWVVGRTGPYVSGLVATGLRLDDRGIEFSLQPNPVAPDQLGTELVVIGQDDFGRYSSDGRSMSYAQAPDASAGTARLRGLVLEAEGNALLGPGLASTSGVTSWSCAPPAAPGPSVEGPDGDERLTVPGTAVVSITPSIVPATEGPATCLVSPDGPTEIWLQGLDATVPVGLGSLRVREHEEAVQIRLVNPDGSPGGEYEGLRVAGSNDVLSGDLRIVGEVEWGPRDPRYVPLGGPGGPRTLRVEITVVCDFRADPLPGVSSGQIDLALGSGIDRSWSVPSVCSWILRDGKAVVTRVVNFEPMEVGGRPFTVQASREPRLVVVGRTRGYERRIASIIAGPVADDGSSGQLTFTGLGLRGGPGNVNDRLGGRGGPELVDGSISWTCGDRPARIPTVDTAP